jgi:predicted DNA binding CopG/RHH family protein
MRRKEGREEIDIMKKKLPKLQTGEEAEEFVADADLTEYDLSQFPTVLFEFQPKTERVNMRLPKTLLDAVKESAAKAGVPYQRFIRQVLEQVIGGIAAEVTPASEPSRTGFQLGIDLSLVRVYS